MTVYTDDRFKMVMVCVGLVTLLEILIKKNTVPRRKLKQSTNLYIFQVSQNVKKMSFFGYFNIQIISESNKTVAGQLSGSSATLRPGIVTEFYIFSFGVIGSTELALVLV